MAALILFLCSLYISSAIGYYYGGYIIGGQPADIKNFPFQVSIRLRTFRHGAGAIISEKFIITAAHCVCFLSIPISEYNIFVGSTQLSGEGQTYAIEHVMCHEGFKEKELINDIGIVGIKNKIIFSASVKPISICRNNIPVGSWLTVSGWGYISYPDYDLSDTLQMVSLRVISLKECKTVIQKQEEPTDEQVQDTNICTLDQINRGTCLGDSGGPLTFNGMLVAVVSWGKPCARGIPDVNTRISKYIKWIRNTIKEYCKTRPCPAIQLYPRFIKIRKHKHI